MKRVHKMIIVVTIAEREERLRRETLHTAIAGYDHKKWADADIQIRQASPPPAV